MSDQQEPLETESEEPTPETGGIDWRKRYEDLRPQYDRTQNELNQYSDPEYRQQLFSQLAEEQGYEFGTEDESHDPTEQLRAELRQEFQQELSKRDQTLANERAAMLAQNYAESQFAALDIPEKSKARDWIETKAMAMPGIHDEFGNVVPDIQAAHLEWVDAMNEVKQGWGNTKRNTVVATEGLENTGVPTWRNEQDPDKRKLMRDAWAHEQIELRLAERNA
jgi:hypothetical protein